MLRDKLWMIRGGRVGIDNMEGVGFGGINLLESENVN